MERVWLKSSFSAESANCVEVSFTPNAVLVRDSRNEDVVVAVTHDDWNAFVNGVHANEFESPHRSA
jgi:hypothetical protein